MHYLLVRAMMFIALIGTNYVHATQEDSYSSKLELRNGYSSPATVRVFATIQGINEGPYPPIENLCVTLNAAKDGVQTTQIQVFPKRYGLVSVEMEGGCKFHDVVDLRSLITIGYKGDIFISLDLPPGTLNEPLPDWLYNSITFKKFNLISYTRKLKERWETLSPENKKIPGIERILDIPSCLHGVGYLPEISTPFPHCLNQQHRYAAIERYKHSHPEIIPSEGEIKKAEQELKTAGVPIFTHD